MDRTRLRDKFLKNQSLGNRFAYYQERNFCVSLIRTTKLEYFTLNQKNVTDNTLFWNKIKPLFSDKRATRLRYTLTEVEEIIDDDQKMSSNLIIFFSNKMSNLNIPQYETHQ